MAPRWKGKGAEAKALAEPMSMLVSQLQSSLTEYNSQGLLSGCTVLLEAHPEQTELLNRACFGRPMITAEKEKQWFQLSFEEALYLCSVLKCITIVAYSHLRKKNWVLRAGSQYGVDFVAYRHHPALVHSEYAVLALSDEDGNTNARLMVWSDFHCTLCLCGSVAKTLLVLHVSKNCNDTVSPWSLEHYSVEERIITRWNPEVNRENRTMLVKSSCNS
ncbi:splicing endonuclease 1 [Perilla frutescens var. frutescens]|nr:splicing endonuclease 1 [Perilla frutescens var. frutescens]